MKGEIVKVMEFHNGALTACWDSVTTCAKEHHTHDNTIKALILSGDPLPSSPRGNPITFDIDPNSPYDIIITKPKTKRKRQGMEFIKNKTKSQDLYLNLDTIE